MIKKVLACLLVFLLAFSVVCGASFTDMPDESHWSYKALASAVESGLLNGSDGKINPNNNLTRAEMATIMVRAYKLLDITDLSMYKDMDSSKWYYVYMQKACAAGLFRGDGEYLNPENNITRQEVFVVMTRALNLLKVDEAVLDSFQDKDLIADWARPSTAAMIASGYIKGSDGMINPKNNITRAEFAQIMYNLKLAGVFGDNTEEKPDEVTPPKEDDKTEDESTGGGGGGGGGGGSSKPNKPGTPTTPPGQIGSIGEFEDGSSDLNDD